MNRFNKYSIICIRYEIGIKNIALETIINPKQIKQSKINLENSNFSFFTRFPCL